MMSLAGTATTEVGTPASGKTVEGLGDLALLLTERSAPYGFVSLLLAGSLARDEGSLLIAPAGPQLFNDVDLVLVTDRPVPPAVSSAWKAESTSLLAPDSAYAGDRLSPLGFHVDLGMLTRRRLGRLPRTLFNFDMMSARVLAGENILPDLRPFQASEIPAREALILLGNRCLSLCESAGPPEAGTALWMYYHSLKAAIDAAGAFLILSGRYATPQKERLSILEEVVRSDYPSFLAHWPHLAETVEAAIADRRELRDDLDWEEALTRWKEARAFILHVLRYSLAQVLRLPEHSSWRTLSTGTYCWWTSLPALADGRHPLAAAARWATLRLAARPRRLSIQAALHAAAPHLLMAVEPGGMSPPQYYDDLARAGTYLSKLSGGPIPDGRDGDWRTLRDATIDRWKRVI